MTESLCPLQMITSLSGPHSLENLLFQSQLSVNSQVTGSVSAAHGIHHIGATKQVSTNKQGDPNQSRTYRHIKFKSHAIGRNVSDAVGEYYFQCVTFVYPAFV